MSKSTQIS